MLKVSATNLPRNKLFHACSIMFTWSAKTLINSQKQIWLFRALPLAMETSLGARK